MGRSFFLLACVHDECQILEADIVLLCTVHTQIYTQIYGPLSFDEVQIISAVTDIGRFLECLTLL